MPRTIRFHLDENVDPRIAVGLGLHGVDVSITPAAGLLGVSDQEQLDYAVLQGRVIITQDTDFLRISAIGQDSPGIVFFHGQQPSIGNVIRGVLLIWEAYDPEEMANRVEYL